MRVAMVLDVTGSMASAGKNIGDANGGQEPGRAAKHAKTGSAKKSGSKPVHRRTGGQKGPSIVGPAKRAVAVLCQIRQKRLTLVRIAAPGIGPVAGRARAVSMRLRRSGGGPIFRVPIRPTGRTGSGDLENALLGTSRTAFARADRAWARIRRPVTPFWNFERLSHVAINLQSLFVRAGKVRCSCSPNEQ